MCRSPPQKKFFFKPESLPPKNFKPKVIELVKYPLLNPCEHNTTTEKRKLNSRPNEEYEVPNEERSTKRTSEVHKERKT